MQKSKIIVITGPTAVGKSEFAYQMAKNCDGEIIYADSRAIYKGFDIVSAKPNKEERAQIKHHLIDILEPDCIFSAGDFVKWAKNTVKEIEERGKTVIICGGTWFYIKAFLGERALIEISSDEKLREDLEKLNNEKLFEMLVKLDKKRSEIVKINDRKKIIRSIEMCKFLNSPVSEYERKKNEEFDTEFHIFVPETPQEREVLYEKINKRVDKMLEMGLYDEFLKNIENWGKENKIISNTIGYREFLENENFDMAVEKIKQHTRNFAKRQITFFKKAKENGF